MSDGMDDEQPEREWSYDRKLNMNRAEVPGGWLVENIDNGALVYVPSPWVHQDAREQLILHGRAGGMVHAIRILIDAGEEKCALLVTKALADMGEP